MDAGQFPNDPPFSGENRPSPNTGIQGSFIGPVNTQSLFGTVV